VKKGICVGSLPKEGSWNERFALAKRAGFDGVELQTVDDAKTYSQIKQAAVDAGITIPSVMDNLHWKCPQSDPDPQVRQQGLDNLRKSLETAAAVGADTVLLVPGVVTAEVSYADAYQQSLESMEAVKTLAAEYKVCVGIENVWNRFLLSPLEFRDFIDRVNSPYVQAYFDVGNIILYGFPEHWIAALAGRIKKVHVKNFLRANYAFTHLLSGDVNWQRVMAELRTVGYDDFLTAELPAYQWSQEQMLFDTASHIGRIMDL